MTSNKLVPRELPAWKAVEQAHNGLVTKLLPDVTKPKGGRPAKFGKAMTAAERKRLQRSK